ncbi:carboxyl-terminal processing protease [Plasticicumulans lactativorans]|uniref:Carboxyl-terminal processing protease n=1 Tax=Plasticicumulans lactativorans TaxID=1133106 RepID=A0A4R2LDS6_9GAMM|nr:S41 family peptidase [Plasticicumulans lactativorans]TCO82762.1 carboxyl-terminal processing protease [Plasticicumulans lactativorans]
MSLKIRPALALGIALALGLGAGHALADDPPPALPLDELRTFAEVLERVKRDYVEPVDDRQLLEAAVKGMLNGLDPHSAFLDKEAYREMQVGTTGEFGGLGIEIGQEDGFVRVIAPIDDTPAARAGILAGDLIIRINDTPTKGMSLTEAVKLMRGPAGSPIKLNIVRSGQDKPIEITLERDIIQVKSVKSRMLEPGFGYVRITQFQTRTAPNLREALDKLRQEAGGTLKGLVLDLRNNPGGVLSGAVEVSDAFLDGGLVVYTEGRDPDSRQNFNANPGDLLGGAPLVVMVNGGSASASEIVAGALQDHRRALIVGERTFGKGSVQTIMPLVDGTALKITTARYFTPRGRSIQAEGITPDILIDALRVTELEVTERLKEADLAGHLGNPNGGGGRPAAPKTDAGATPLAKSDYPLNEALNLLKGLALMRPAS